MTTHDDEYNPRRLPSRVARNKRSVAPKPKRAAQDEGRLPFVKKTVEWFKGTEVHKRNVLRNEAKTLEVETKHVKTQRGLTKQHKKLVEEDTKLLKAQQENTLENFDAEEAMKHELSQRRAKREDAATDRAWKREKQQMDRETKRARYEQRKNPKRGKGQLEKMKERYRKYEEFGSDGIHMQAWWEVYEEAVAKYGGEDKIPQPVYDNLMRGREDAQQRDNSKG